MFSVITIVLVFLSSWNLIWLLINKINGSLYIIWLLEEITNNSNKYCIFGLTFQSPLLWKVSPNIQYLLELFVISSNNQIMYKLLFILFIIKLYAQINIFKWYGYVFWGEKTKSHIRKLKNKPVSRYLTFQVLGTCDQTSAKKYMWPDLFM